MNKMYCDQPIKSCYYVTEKDRDMQMSDKDTK